MVLLSITGLFKTLLIVVGVIVIMRFIGKLMIAKRSIDEHKNLNQSIKNQNKIMDEAKDNYGKISISKKKSTNLDDDGFTPFEEVK